MESIVIANHVLTLVTMVFSAFLCFFTVRECLLYSWTRLMTTTVTATILIIIICSFIPIQLEPFPYLIAGFLYYRHTVKVPTIKLAFILLVAADYMMLNSSVFIFIEGLELPVLHYLALCIVSPIPLLPLAAWMMRKKLWPAMCDMGSEEFRALLPIAAIFLLIILFFSQQFPIVTFMYDWLRVALTFLLGAAFFGIVMLMVSVLQKTAENARHQQNMRIIETRLVTQSERYEEIAAHTQEIKTLRHDMRHHLMVLNGMLTEHRYEEATHYLTDYAGQMELVERPLCGCYVVDIIARKYKAQAEANGIKTNFKLTLPERNSIADTDLCIVLGNLMENAVHACTMQSQGKKFFNVLAKAEGSDVFISVENSCIPEASARYVGLGISSVQAVATKYGGFTKFEQQEGVYRATVLMYTASQ